REVLGLARRWNRRRLAVLVLAAATVAVSSASSATLSAEVVAYMGHGTLYTINVDGTGRHPLISGAAEDTFNWSPDGKSIAFTAGEMGGGRPPNQGRNGRRNLGAFTDARPSRERGRQRPCLVSRR